MQDFFDYLEYSISRALANSADSEKLRCWCDGIMLPEIGDAYQVQYNKGANQEEIRWIDARAWIEEGKTKTQPAKQRIYTMRVFLGRHSWASYQAGKDLKNCIPSETNDDWIGLDIRQSYLVVVLL
jgi:hypothetical protein